MARPEGAQAFLRPFGSKRHSRAASHTKTLKIVGLCDFQLSPLPKIGEGFGGLEKSAFQKAHFWKKRKNIWTFEGLFVILQREYKGNRE